MDQIVSTFGINSKLLLIQAINFAILLFLLRRFLYRPILKLMDERQKKIDQGITDAKQAATELADAWAEREKIVVAAKSEAKEMVDKAVQASEKMRDGILRDAEEKSREIISISEKTAQEETHRIAEEAKKEVGAFALATVERLLHERVGEKEEREYVKRAIQE